MNHFLNQAYFTVKLAILPLCFLSQTAFGQFDTIPTNKAPKASYTTWKYSAGVTDITDNATGHSVSSAFELKGNNVDIIYAPTVTVTSTGNVTGTVKFNLANYQESSSVGQVAVSVLVDGGTSSAVTYSAFTTATGTNSWKSFSFSGNFLSGVHTYTAFFSNPSNNPIAIDDLNFGFTGATSVSLPVLLDQFTATTNGNTILLNWATLTESNNAGFYVERSTDGGSNFSDLIFEPTKATNGNSNYKIDYSYSDVTPNDGINYYRLKQIDIDGKLTYSTVVTSKTSGIQSLKVYPNPAINNLAISGVENGAMFKVVSIGSGQTVLTTTVSSSNLDISNLLPGIYMLQTTVKGTLQIIRFVKQ